MLKEHDFPVSISSGNSSAIDEFFVPCLNSSIEYKVAVAYFTSGWVRDAAPGLANFVENGGRLYWIISPELTDEDWKAIQATPGENAKHRLVWDRTESLLNRMLYEPRKVISWLIADRLLEIKLAIPTSLATGIFHSKVGVFTDSQGYQVAFSGSYNQTAGANKNWERLEIFTEHRDSDRVKDVAQYWDQLWEGQEQGMELYSPSEIDLLSLKNTAPGSRPYKIKKTNLNDTPVPNHISLRDYQREAVKSWFDANGNGIFVMATGTGKTITALACCAHLAKFYRDHNKTLRIVICLPYKHLLDQWVDDCNLFGFTSVACYGDNHDWPSSARQILSDISLTPGTGIFLTTYDTLRTARFRSFLGEATSDLLFLGDEIHNALGEKTIRALPNNAKYRLGLTATPARSDEDLESVEKLEGYFGKTVFEFGIGNAIAQGFLTEYEYYPIVCPLSDEEQEEYLELSDRIALAYTFKNDEKNETLDKLLIRRARLIGDIDSKYQQLANQIKCERHDGRRLVYCSDYSEDENSPITKVSKQLANEGLRLRHFTHRESQDERAEIIHGFELGELDAVVAIRCLDEGVDIPSVTDAYLLASTTNQRQFIQRRGRVLRLAPGKHIARIYDFVAIPADAGKGRYTGAKPLKSLLNRELDRVREFAYLAQNYHQQRDTIKALEEMVK